MKIFLAASSQDLPAARKAMHLIRDLGHQTFDWAQSFDTHTHELTLADARKIAEIDLTHLGNADALIWMINPEHSSHGAPYEAGWANREGLPTVAFWPNGIEYGWIYGHHYINGYSTIEDCVDAIENPTPNPRTFTSIVKMRWA